MKPVIAISMGDYNGIGPEVVLKTLSQTDRSRATPVVLGHEKVFRFYTDKMGLEFNTLLIERGEDIENAERENTDSILFLNCTGKTLIDPDPGVIHREAGKASMLAVEKGVELCMAQHTHALVTAPISKEAIQLAGYAYPGHTEFLAKKTAENDFMMMMVSNGLRIGLATVHIPISEVPRQIHRQSLLRILRLFNKSLREDFEIEEPRIAVLGLNPHAGDGGVIGREEKETLSPAIQNASATSVPGRFEGPFAADGFFGNKMFGEFDGILAMYHDQGLIPFKALTFGSGVNFSAGLPIIRTSPDHGTAFGIAGKNLASHDSFTSAYELAIRLACHKLKK
ncbi:MAG: 4-hydroxythreonine-4-phosphate dehydrogenase PdxA [Balneolaceae bacterium]